MATSPAASLADQIIAALRANHEKLTALVGTLSAEDLAQTSGSTEWPVAQVLSHLGSGAEINQATLLAALGTGPEPADDFNAGVWDRWNAMSHAEQASSFLAADEALVSTYEAITAEQRESLPIPLSFLPTPLSVAGAAGLRLNEAAQHSWDVQIAFDPDAEIDGTEAPLLAELFAGDLGFLLGFFGHADELTDPTTITLADTPFAIAVGDGVSLTSGAADPTASFNGPLPAAIRLLGGRLTPAHTPAEVSVSGNVTLDALRQVFPGT